MESSNKTRLNRISAFIFVLIQAAFWLCLNFITPDSLDKYFMFGAVLLALIYSLLSRRSYKSVLISLALVFTCISDIFLVMLDGSHKTLAMCFFLCAQTAYAVRVYRLATSDGERLAQVISRVALSLICAIAVFAVLNKEAEALFVISLVYFANLFLNIVFSFAHFRSSPSAKLLSIGFLSFALCDISIGFDFLVDIFSLGEDSFIYVINDLPCNFAHLFYPPSQALLCLSGKARG